MDDLIRHASELYTASGVAKIVLDLTRSDDFVVSELVGHIEKDPALTTRVLATVNSSRFGLPRQVSNLQQAVALLGRRALHTIALSFGVVESLARNVDKNVYKDFWRRALTTSLVADRLSRKMKKIDANDAYISGLLADIGVLALAQFKPDVYLPVYGRHAHGPELVAAERSSFGFDHAEFGACLLEVWQFPSTLTDAVAAHHDEQRAAQIPLAQLILTGNLLPDAVWLAKSAAFDVAFPRFQALFGFNEKQFVTLALEVNQAVAREAEVYQVGGLNPLDDESLRVIKEAYGL